MTSELHFSSTRKPRASGILLPIFSLPSQYGIGSLGKPAYRFIDFLKRSGQTYWQILPVGPTSIGDSPYQSFSAYAGNPYFIDLDLLADQKLLTGKELETAWCGNDSVSVDYAALYHCRLEILEHAVARFDDDTKRYQRFAERTSGWLDDYALFMALKEENGMISFLQWEDSLRLRSESALRCARTRLERRIRFWKIVQYLFFEQWKLLKSYAHSNGIRIIGDIPVYVAMDSSDMWAHRELFQVDAHLVPTAVSGCPPDAFAPDGQLWGNPLYNWEYLEQTDFKWWLCRLAHAVAVYDVVRIDHFRGLSSYYAIPFGNQTAAGGVWMQAPGRKLIAAIRQFLPGVPVIAEDLGYLTDDVRKLLLESGFPGMKVLQFAFDSREESDYLPHNYEHNCVVYTGTHDNTTTEDWQQSAPAADVAFARKYLQVPVDGSLTDGFVRAAIASVADTAIIPLQDYLKYGVHARINTPGTQGTNWRWRVPAAVLTDRLSESIYDLTALYGRLPV